MSFWFLYDKHIITAGLETDFLENVCGEFRQWVGQATKGSVSWSILETEGLAVGWKWRVRSQDDCRDWGLPRFVSGTQQRPNESYWCLSLQTFLCLFYILYFAIIFFFAINCKNSYLSSCILLKVTNNHLLSQPADSCLTWSCCGSWIVTRPFSIPFCQPLKN